MHDALFDALRNLIDMVCLEVGSPTVQCAERKIGDSRTNVIVGGNQPLHRCSWRRRVYPINGRWLGHLRY